jgi:hypothetical protein
MCGYRVGREGLKKSLKSQVEGDWNLGLLFPVRYLCLAFPWSALNQLLMLDVILGQVSNGEWSFVQVAFVIQGHPTGIKIHSY